MRFWIIKKRLEWDLRMSPRRRSLLTLNFVYIFGPYVLESGPLFTLFD